MAHVAGKVHRPHHSMRIYTRVLTPDKRTSDRFPYKLCTHLIQHHLDGDKRPTIAKLPLLVGKMMLTKWFYKDIECC